MKLDRIAVFALGWVIGMIACFLYTLTLTGLPTGKEPHAPGVDCPSTSITQPIANMEELRKERVERPSR